MTTGGRCRRGDDGTGLIATMAAVVVFLMFLVFAVQLLFGLYATSTITAVTHDTATRAAGRDASRSDAALATYTADARDQLGRMGDAGRAFFDWQLPDDDGDGTADFVVLTVRTRPPRVVPPSIGGMIGFEEITRTVRVRIEQFDR
jgi:Na+-transporting methylmalonyl-CoA/oxaloacetate decarboxylase gamma subunit